MLAPRQYEREGAWHVPMGAMSRSGCRLQRLRLAVAEISCLQMPHQDVHIRRLNADDYHRMAEIWSEAGLPFRPNGRDGQARVQAEMQGDSAIFLGAEIDGELVAVVLGTHDGRKGWINRLAVLPEYRKRGIAKALTLEVERRLNDAGILIVTCLIEGDNPASEAFFQSLGYIGHPDITYYSKRKSPDW